MKLKKISLLCLSLTLGLMSCSKDSDGLDAIENEQKYEGTTFASLTINVGDVTKAAPGEDGDGIEVGEEGEQLISELYIFSFKSGDDNALLFRKDFGMIIVNQQKGQTGAFSIPVGEQKMYIVANPSETIKDVFKDGSITLPEFEQIVFTEQNSKSGNFMMSSCDGAELINPSKGDILNIDVNLSRILAKITYVKQANNADNSYAFSKSTIQLTGAKIINKHKNEYLLRRVGTSAQDWIIGGKEKATGLVAENYVIDPDFFIKDPSLNNDLDIIKNKSNYYESDLVYTDLGTADSKLIGYCLENTMHADAQYQTYTTGIVLSAKCDIDDSDFYTAPKDGDEYRKNKTFYRTADGRLYPSLEAIVYAYDPNYQKVSENPNYQLELSSKNVKYETFKEGVCYYPVWLRHADNQDEKNMGVMEFGIVRNNVYKLKVTKIKGLGLSKDDGIEDSKDPDEDPKVYLDASVTIMPWIVRENNVEL